MPTPVIQISITNTPPSETDSFSRLFCVCVFVFCLQGELRTATGLDREVASAYKLIAQATDAGGLFCRSDISLRVLDVNDNAPSFSAPYYLASVYENAAPKALLTRLQASDPDEGELFPYQISTIPKIIFFFNNLLTSATNIAPPANFI